MLSTLPPAPAPPTLRVPSPPAGNESVPLPIEGALLGKRVKKVTAGDSHTSALTSEGQVYSWGAYKDSNGHIGYSASKDKAAAPTLVPNLPTVKTIASGTDHTL